MYNIHAQKEQKSREREREFERIDDGLVAKLNAGAKRGGGRRTRRRLQCASSINVISINLCPDTHGLEMSHVASELKFKRSPAVMGRAGPSILPEPHPSEDNPPLKCISIEVLRVLVDVLSRLL